MGTGTRITADRDSDADEERVLLSVSIRSHPRSGQTTVEYAVVFAVVLAALLAMQGYAKRGFSGRLRLAADSVGEAYDPRHTTSRFTVETAGETTAIVRSFNELEVADVFHCVHCKEEDNGRCKQLPCVEYDQTVTHDRLYSSFTKREEDVVCTDLNENGRCDPHVFATVTTIPDVARLDCRQSDGVSCDPTSGDARCVCRPIAGDLSTTSRSGHETVGPLTHDIWN